MADVSVFVEGARVEDVREALRMAGYIFEEHVVGEMGEETMFLPWDKVEQAIADGLFYIGDEIYLKDGGDLVLFRIKGVAW